MYYTNYNSPLGNIIITADENNLTGLYFRNEFDLKDKLELKDNLVIFDLVIDWLNQYFNHENPSIKAIPIKLNGTDFQMKVWDILLQIPYGQTITYKEIAQMFSERMSSQAVGGAVGRNPISIIVPCHRVIGTNGSLTGYASGLDNKIFLLDLEEIKYKK